MIKVFDKKGDGGIYDKKNIPAIIKTENYDAEN
jgi:hypothetical protein